MYSKIYFQFFVIELKRILAYRVSFWLNLVLSTIVKIMVAWYLWDAIFIVSNSTSIGGFTKEQMQFYFFLVPIVADAIMSKGSDFATEIYDGSLTKYLVYPVNYFLVCYSRHLASYMFGLFRFFVGLMLYALIFEFPSDFVLSTRNFSIFIFVSFLATSLHFIINLCVDFMAFWMGVIWNLKVMLRFCINLLGGVLLPITAFSPPIQNLIEKLPFQHLCWLPVNILLKNETGNILLQNIGILSIWIFVFTILGVVVFKRGQYQYSGVGI